MSRLAGAAVVLSLVLTACGDDGAAGCTELREPEDPASFQHVIGPSDFEYLSYPPTSGPHVGGAAPVGVLGSPIVAPIQVRILEEGFALVQYDPEQIEAGSVADLTELGAVVAPGAELPAAVVVTAWTWKLTCPGVDVDRMTGFIENRTREAPGED